MCVFVCVCVLQEATEMSQCMWKIEGLGQATMVTGVR